MQLKVKHIFIICFAVLVLSTVVLTSLNAIYIRKNNQRRAAVLVSALMQLHSSYMYKAEKTTRPISGKIALNHTDMGDSKFSAHLQTNKPSLNYFELPASHEPLAENDYNVLVQALINNKQLLTASFLPQLNRWLTMQVTFQPISAWSNLLPILLTQFTAMLIIWVCFLLFYHYTLPQEVLQLLIGDQKTRHLNDKLINDLRRHLQTYVDHRTIMITALAHDIKTPLTEALLHLELLDDDKAIKNVKNKLENINNIVRSSLEYARQPERIRKVNTEVVSLVETVADRYRQTDFEVVFTPYTSGFNMMVEIELFKRMLANLIENAQKYATSCEVIVSNPSRYTLEIVCQDNGPGVPDQLLGLISVPYFRADQSRSSKQGGSGLGLAIVKKIVELHHGQIKYQNQPGGGFRVTITFDKRKQRRFERQNK